MHRVHRAVKRYDWHKKRERLMEKCQIIITVHESQHFEVWSSNGSNKILFIFAFIFFVFIGNGQILIWFEFCIYFQAPQIIRMLSYGLNCIFILHVQCTCHFYWDLPLKFGWHLFCMKTCCKWSGFCAWSFCLCIFYSGVITSKMDLNSR